MIYFTEKIGNDDDAITLTRLDKDNKWVSFYFDNQEGLSGSWDNPDYLINMFYPILKSFVENKMIPSAHQTKELNNLTKEYNVSSFEFLNFFLQNEVLEMFDKAIELGWFKKENDEQ